MFLPYRQPAAQVCPWSMPCAANIQMTILPAAITASGGGPRPVNGVYSVARPALLALLRLTMESEVAEFAAGLRLRESLTAEFRAARLASGETCGHDDLVAATALALWAAAIRKPSLFKPDEPLSFLPLKAILGL